MKWPKMFGWVFAEKNMEVVRSPNHFSSSFLSGHFSLGDFQSQRKELEKYEVVCVRVCVFGKGGEKEKQSERRRWSDQRAVKKERKKERKIEFVKKGC